MYQYAAKLHHIVDGDTVDLLVDVGFMCNVRVRFRLHGIDTPEMKLTTLAAGKAAKAHLASLLADAQLGIIRVDSTGRDKYGRWVAKLQYVGADGEIVDVNNRMICDGHAVPEVM